MVKSKFSSFNFQDDHQMAKTELLRNTKLRLLFKWIKTGKFAITKNGDIISYRNVQMLFNASIVHVESF